MEPLPDFNNTFRIEGFVPRGGGGGWYLPRYQVCC